MIGRALVRTIISMHITIAAAAGLVSGLGGWTLLRTTGSPKSPPIWSSSRHGLTAVSLCVVIISVTGVVGSARRSRSWLCCYMVSTLVLIVSQIAFAAVLLGHLPNRVLRRRPVTGDTGIISSGERAEEEFWEQLFDAQYISCYCAFIGAALMFINVILTFAFQLQEYPKVVAKMHSTRSSLIQTRC